MSKEELEAMEQLIHIILNEYPKTDERYQIALAIAIKYGYGGVLT